MDSGMLLTAFLTTMATIFVTELTDKDALFLLALATKAKPSLVFAAGVVAFTTTTVVIIVLGSILITLVPVIAIKLAGGAIMLAYAGLEFSRFSKEEKAVNARKEELLEREGPSAWSIFLPAVATLVVLDLAGDATELVTVVLLARFQDALVVFAGALGGLYAGVAVETALGRRLGTIFSPKRIKSLSIVVFLAIGTIVIITSLFGA